MAPAEGAGTIPIQSSVFESNTLTKNAGEGGAGTEGEATAPLIRSMLVIAGKYELSQSQLKCALQQAIVSCAYAVLVAMELRWITINAPARNCEQQRQRHARGNVDNRA